VSDVPQHAQRRQSLRLGTAEYRHRRCEPPHAGSAAYTLRNKASGELVQTTDPGRELITGNTHFSIGLSARAHAGLVAFLRSL
jgi:hypothetical protein